MFVRFPDVRVLGLATLTLLGCEAEPADVCRPLNAFEREALIDHDLWQPTEASDDPWRLYRPLNTDCAPEFRQAEDFGGYYSFGIDSEECLYTTVSQPSQAGLCQGDTFFVWLWYFNQTQFTPLQECEAACVGNPDCVLPPGCTPSEPIAHIEFQIGDEHLVAKALPVPVEGDFLFAEVKTQKPHPKGTPVYFHIRNHGDNTYQLVELSRCQGDCRP